MNTLGKKLIRTKEQRFNQAECDKIQREALALRERIAIMMTQKLWLVPENKDT